MGGIALDEWQKEILDTPGSIVLCSGRQVGKSTIISIRDGKRAAEKAKESILIIAPTERQAQEIFYKTLDYLEDNYSYLIKKGKERPTKHIINLKNGSVIRCLPTGLAGIGIRGFTISKLTVEEAAYMPEEVFSAVTPMLLTTGGDMDLLGTPHGAKGYFYECFKNINGHFKVFNVNSEQVIKNRPISESWTEAQRKGALEHLEREKARMSVKEYTQEYMGVFNQDLNQFFPDELILKTMKLKRDRFKPGRTYFLGVDVARMGDDEITFEIIDRTDRKNLVHVESIVHKKKYLSETYNKILELDKQYDFKAIYIDDAGLGVGVFDYLLENVQTKRKIVAINNKSRPLDYEDKFKKKMLKEDLYNNLLGLMERKEIALLDDDEIMLSFKSVQYEYVTSSKENTRLRIFGNYTHIVEGLIRAAWCNRDKRLGLWVR